MRHVSQEQMGLPDGTASRGRPKGTYKKMPSYREHKASRQAVVTLAGKDIYLGIYNSKASKAEYERVIGEWLLRGRVHKTGSASITISELLSARLARLLVQHPPKPTGGQQSTVLLFMRLATYLRHDYGHIPVDEFGPLSLRTIREKMIDEPLRRRNGNATMEKWSRQYVNILVRKIKGLFAWGVSYELVSPATLQALATVEELPYTEGIRECDPVKPAEDSLVAGTLRTATPTIASMIFLQWLTGMRPGEVCVMRACDIDRSGETWLYRPHKHKLQHLRRSRVIPLTGQAKQIVSQWLTADERAYLFTPEQSWRQAREHRREHAKTDRFTLAKKRGWNEQWERRNGKVKKQFAAHYSPGHYRRAIEMATLRAFPTPVEIRNDPQAVKAWNEKHYWHPNQLRHSFATRVRSVLDLTAAKEMLGHSREQTTLIYAEPDYLKIGSLMQKVNEIGMGAAR